MDQNGSSTKLKRTRKKGIDICYSFSNITLIVASIISFMLTAQQFFFDGPLYYFRNQLGLNRYYYHTFYIIVVSLFTFAIPVCNAIVVTKKTWKESYSYNLYKTLLQVGLVVLTIIALQLISTTIRWSSMVTQFGVELRRHMKRKYENDFSFEFIELIQSHFRCCDEQWYRVNHLHTLPLSCYNSTALDMAVYKESCANILAGIVCNRSIIIMLCLALIVIGLSFLSGIDIMELFMVSNRPKPKSPANEVKEEHAIRRSLLEVEDTTKKVNRSKINHKDQSESHC